MEYPDEHIHEKKLPADASVSNGFFSLWTGFDIDLFKAGKHYRLYEKFGAHKAEHNGSAGVYFSVWAPNAALVSVVGNFNGWNKNSHPMQLRWDGSGIWEIFISALEQGEYYKYHVFSPGGYEAEKADP